MKVILGGSSMAQCVAALLGVLQTNFGVAECDITMIQANTAAHTNTVDDRVEAAGRDWRLGRGAAQNIIPTTNSETLTEEVFKVVWMFAVDEIVFTHIAQVTGWRGAITTSSYLVPPTCPVSVVDLTVRLEREVEYSEVCQRLRKLAQAGPLRRVVGYSEAPLVSSDLVTDCHSAVLDTQAGRQTGPDTLKLVAW